MEATGRGHSDVWVYCLLGVKGPWSGQQGALPVRAGGYLGLPMFCSPLALLFFPTWLGNIQGKGCFTPNQGMLHQYTTQQAGPGSLPEQTGHGVVTPSSPESQAALLGENGSELI